MRFTSCGSNSPRPTRDSINRSSIRSPNRRAPARALRFGRAPVEVVEVRHHQGLGLGTLLLAVLAAWGVLPFAVADGVRLLLLCLVPGLATWLPRVLS